MTDIRASDILAPNTLWTIGATTDITVDMQSTTMLFASASLGPSTASFEADFPPRQAANPIALRAFQAHVRFEYVLISQQQSALPCP